MSCHCFKVPGLRLSSPGEETGWTRGNSHLAMHQANLLQPRCWAGSSPGHNGTGAQPGQVALRGVAPISATVPAVVQEHPSSRTHRCP